MSTDSVQEILFTDLQQNDTLVMETGRSVYTFTVVDRSNRRGSLTGGNVPHPRDAVFSGSLLPTRDIWESGVRLGARAAFFFAPSAGDGADPSTGRTIRIVRGKS